ncbi:hypothetical protein GCM10027605_07880 [Micromonospora zhanjiangensis]
MRLGSVSMSSLSYEIVDVFTDRPFAGNPLAVVFGAQALGTAQLQALTREFNLSETVFVLPPTRPGASYRARIFTVDGELPFAGHPSVGAAVTAVGRGLFPPEGSSRSAARACCRSSSATGRPRSPAVRPPSAPNWTRDRCWRRPA